MLTVVSGKKSAYHKLSYDEEKNVMEKEVEGVQAIRTFLFLMAPLLGLTRQDVEEDEHVKNCLSKSLQKGALKKTI